MRLICFIILLTTSFYNASAQTNRVKITNEVRTISLHNVFRIAGTVIVTTLGSKRNREAWAEATAKPPTYTPVSKDINSIKDWWKHHHEYAKSFHLYEPPHVNSVTVGIGNMSSELALPCNEKLHENSKLINPR